VREGEFVGGEPVLVHGERPISIEHSISAEWGLVSGSSSNGRGPRGESERPTHFDLLRTL